MGKKILLVDDDRVLLKFLTNLLEREGHEVVTVEDGISALNLLTSFTPEIIFLDIILPQIDGDKLCRIIRRMQHLKGCYLVIISAVVAEMEDSFAHIGADSFIAKGPFQMMGEHVLAAIDASSTPRREDIQQTVMGLEKVSPRQLTKELLYRNRHLETILESMAEGILEIFDGKIVFANSEAIQLLGVPEEKLLATHPEDLFDETTRPRIIELLNSTDHLQAAIGENTPLEFKGRQVTVRYIPVSGYNSSSIIFISDITDRKRLEMQLQHAQNMEAIGTIASGVAHNFRNTLTGILVNSQVLQDSYPEDNGLNEIVERINKAVKRGAHLVERLMQFSRKQTRKEFQQIDMVSVIAETYQIIRKSFDRKIRIDVDIRQSLPILGDHTSLSQVLMNLCTNARDAMAPGGTLKIEARREGKHAVIVVSDTGHGMNKDTLEKCFDPFFTTKDVGKGTGLGLSITYGIVKRHEGEILIQSSPGQGAVFFVRLPLADSQDMPEPARLPDIVRGNGEPILVVDDEADIQTAMQDLLECLGYRPLLAGGGQEALDRYDVLKPGVVLMDVNMPDMDGLSCAEKIIEHDPQAKIAVISAYDVDSAELDPDRLAKYTQGYLAKPVDVAELSALLSRLLQSN